MNIVFDCLGFSSATVFVVKDGRQIQIGFIRDIFHQEYEFSYFGLYERYLTKDEIPTPQEVLEEYRKQLEIKGVFINKKIRHAG